MTPEQFCYWLQGFAEIHQDQPNGQEWLTIMDRLSRVTGWPIENEIPFPDNLT